MISRTGAVFLLSRLYSHSSNVCTREWQMGRWVWSVHSSEECAGLRQVLHCTACLKRVSSSAGRARRSDVIDMLCALLSRKTLLITSSLGFPVRSTTAKVVHGGSQSPVRNNSVSSSGVGERVSCFLKFWKRMTNCGNVLVAPWTIE